MPYLGIFFGLGVISITAALDVHTRRVKQDFSDSAAFPLRVTRSRLCLVFFSASLWMFALGFGAMLVLGDWWELHKGIPQGPVALITLPLCAGFGIRVMLWCLRRDISIDLLPDGIIDHMAGKRLLRWPQISDAVERGENHILLHLVEKAGPPGIAVRIWRFFVGSRYKVAINLTGADVTATTLVRLIKSNIKKPREWA